MKNLVSRVLAAAGSGTLSVVAVFGGGGVTFGLPAPPVAAAPTVIAVVAIIVGAVCYGKLQKSGKR